MKRIGDNNHSNYNNLDNNEGQVQNNSNSLVPCSNQNSNWSSDSRSDSHKKFKKNQNERISEVAYRDNTNNTNTNNSNNGSQVQNSKSLVLYSNQNSNWSSDSHQDSHQKNKTDHSEYNRRTSEDAYRGKQINNEYDLQEENRNLLSQLEDAENDCAFLYAKRENDCQYIEHMEAELDYFKNDNNRLENYNDTLEECLEIDDFQIDQLKRRISSSRKERENLLDRISSLGKENEKLEEDKKNLKDLGQKRELSTFQQMANYELIINQQKDKIREVEEEKEKLIKENEEKDAAIKNYEEKVKTLLVLSAKLDEVLHT